MPQREEPLSVESGPASPLIHAGWDQLRRQNPLAAWGCWREATRIDPGSKAAQQALDTLEKATELPLAARVHYRFLSPNDSSRRKRWDSLLRGSNPDELSSAAGVFADLTDEDPDDAEAWFNHGLCLAWTGRNSDAIESLDRFVILEAANQPETAVAAWTLAEILRQGYGAETLSDDSRYSITLSWNSNDGASLLKHAPELRQVPTPVDPTSGGTESAGLNVYEWLEEAGDATPPESPRAIAILATLYESPTNLRLSSPSADLLEQAVERLERIVELNDRSIRREASPLPLPFLDAAVWTVRLLGTLDQESADQLRRERVESYYENSWIHLPRLGLDGRSPLEAAFLASQGDNVLNAKLLAVIQLKEQLGMRPSAVRLYQGYPFDRLRVRLGLTPIDANTVDMDDLSTCSPQGLEKLDPASLSDERLLSAFESAVGLREDRLGERFASELLKRPAALRGGCVRKAMTACLVRGFLARKESSRALALIEQIETEEGCSEADRRALTTWRAEILARDHRGAQAAEIYRSLLDSTDQPASLALDAAETLIDNQDTREARPFLDRAIRLARAAGLEGLANHAQSLLDSLH